MFERAVGLLVRGQKTLDLLTQCGIIGARIVEIISPLRGWKIHHRFKEGLDALVRLIHELELAAH